MKITIVQPDTIWEDKQANFSNIKQILRNHPGETDIVVLPEMFTTGFTLNAERLAEEPDGETHKWMANLALSVNSAICGSFIIRSGNNYYNRFAFITPGNAHFSYDKRHLFSMADENRIFTSGKTRQVFEYNGFRFLPLICYDLRFPVWSRCRGDYDAIICVASWPDVRREAWNSLLKARAIENQCYVVGVNRTGVDNEGLKYAGDSVIIDPLGKILTMVKEYEAGSATADISLPELQNFREKFPVWKDADDFSLNI
ncbi:MAG: amidohydrolase [Odoribacter sp.]|nr:amidohydrolase [Odoribacter sp.]